MRLAYHPQVQRDVNRILRHYDRISLRLGNEFWAEFTRIIDLVASKPQRFHSTQQGLRRANMRRFPYHVLFRENPGGVRVIVLRHNRRRPSYGTSRR
jgi:plasmid stabilization system protein ParE